MKYSIVIPFYKEEGNVKPLIEDIIAVMQNDFSGNTYEIIAVNDGSKDGTRNDIQGLSHYDQVIGINLQRNYGQATALQAGFDASQGEYIFTLDGDGQNNPKDFIRLRNELQDKNLDVVAGWRKERKDPNWMMFITKRARFLRKVFIDDGVHDSGCTLRIYKKEVVKQYELWAEMHRYMIALAKINGFAVGEIVVDHRERVIGTTKYNRKKSFKGFIDLIYIWFMMKYQPRPLHIFGFGGLCMVGVGVITFLYSLYERLFQGHDISDNGFFLLAFFGVTIGLILFLFGMVMDILIRVKKQTPYTPMYRVKQ